MRLICLLLVLAFASPAEAQVTGGTAPPNFYAFTDDNGATHFTNTTGLTLSNATLSAKTFVQIIVGQSVGASHVQGNYVATGDCRMVNMTGDRKVYLDNQGGTMLGATFSASGYQGWTTYTALWAKECDLLIAGGKFDRVITINASYAGEPIAKFMPGGVLGHLLPLAFFTLNELGIKANQVNAIIAMEGESDGIAGTAQATYQAAMQSWFTVAANLGFTGKWIVPLETYAYGCTSSTIRAAQAAVVNGTTVIAGPDLDTFVGATNRYAEVASGGCAVNALVHPNATGRDNIAGALKATIYANF